MIRLRIAVQGCGSGFGLVYGILHRFQPQQRTVGQAARGAVASRDDGRVGRAPAGVHHDAAVAGDTPNLALGLRALASPGQIVVAESTRRVASSQA